MVGLLVSVRGAEEATRALKGGADWIDVKEPRRGALGRATLARLQEVGRAVDGAVPCSAAMGELLLDAPGPALAELPDTYRLAKVGLAGCGGDPNWRSKWRQCFAGAPSAIGSVAVVYADWKSAASPAPDDVLRSAVSETSQFLLIDTFDKTSGNLFDCFPPPRLRSFCHEVRAAGLGLVLAGSLDLSSMSTALTLSPDFVAVRGAACRGDRASSVDTELVRQLRASINVQAEKQIAIS